MRTSTTHPLEIAEILLDERAGKVGITFCPGKQQPASATGGWERDLTLDLEAISSWNPAALVTLLEDHELVSLGVPELGKAVRDRHISWYHLPIRDAGSPDQAFERAWAKCGLELVAMLRGGFNVLVHCKGGLGRAGMIAARLLAEYGMAPADAVKEVRAVRPGAIETMAQFDHVMGCGILYAPKPTASLAAAEDRALGAMLGLAIGDALGTSLEFAKRDMHPRIEDMVGGGPFKLKPGEWTDDTAMALALIDSLLADPDLDEADLMSRFTEWHEQGRYSCTGTCFDIGVTTRRALARWKESGDPFAGSTNPRSAGNGSLMRLAPVAIRHWQDPQLLCDVAARQSRTTHGAAEAVDACIFYAQAMANCIAGRGRRNLMETTCEPQSPAVAQILTGSWRGKHHSEIASSGYVLHSLEATLWCIGRTGNFHDAVLHAANLADDADTTAAITGQLAGALYGARKIPKRWKEQLAWYPQIVSKTKELFAAGVQN